MHLPNPEFVLPKLRRQLEEILAIVNQGPNCAMSNHIADVEAVLSVPENDDGVADPVIVRACEYAESHKPCVPMLLDEDQTLEGDLYNDALVVVTEFGQASPAVLQMWLSIDYGRAMTILDRFQADGLVSSKGRVRHKAYSLRRSEG